MARSNKLLKYGLPFFTLVFGGAVALVQFSRIRYDFRKTQLMTREEFEKESGIKMRKPEEVSPERQLEEMKKMDIDNWQNIRGPRPWEENNEGNEQQKQLSEQKRRRSTNVNN